jgi:cytochrome c peroxidase
MPTAARLIGVLLPLWLASCGGSSSTTVQDTTPNQTGAWSWRLPANFPLPLEPTHNPMSNAKVELGRHLFYDVRLSGNGTQSCGSCHQQDKAFTDGLPTAIGATGEAHPRNTQSIINVVYSPTLTWANSSLLRLEVQMLTPLFGEHPVEMGITDQNKAQVLARFQNSPLYAPLFSQAFPNDSAPITLNNIILAISSFQRSIIAGDSRYDRYLQNKAALSAAEIRGRDLFFSEKAECFHCHQGFNFNDQVVHASTRGVDIQFHNNGLYNIGGTGAYPEHNGGIFELTGKATDMGKFRAPSLRNVALTAPYNHDGSVATLEDVLANYAAGGRVITEGVHAGDGRLNPYKDDLIVRIDLTEAEQQDIVAFLKTLTDETVLVDPRFANPFVSKSGASAQ